MLDSLENLRQTDPLGSEQSLFKCCNTFLERASHVINQRKQAIFIHKNINDRPGLLQVKVFRSRSKYGAAC